MTVFEILALILGIYYAILKSYQMFGKRKLFK